MTALWRAGIEMPLGTTTEFSAGSFGAATQDTTIKRSGMASLKFTGLGSARSTAGLNQPRASQRAYIYLSASPGAASRIMGLASTTGHLASLRLRTDRKLELQLNGPPAAMTLLATSTFTLPTGSFEQCCELWVDRTTNILAARYNETEWARTSVTAFADANLIDHGFFGPDEAALTGCTIQYDDLAINSLDGAHNNGWCGPSAGGVLTFWPHADASVTPATWVTVGAGSVAEALDEATPDDATSYIAESTGTNGAAAGFYFPTWPLRTPASAVLFGVRGGGTDTTSREAILHFHDAADAFSVNAISPVVDWNLNGWKTVYPMLTVQEAMDGTRRMLNNGYLYPSPHPGLFEAGARSRAIVVRTDALVREIRISTVWMTVDFPLTIATRSHGFGHVPYAAYPFGHPMVPIIAPSVPSSAILTTLDP